MLNLIVNKANYIHTLNNIKNSKITDKMKNTVLSFDKAARDAVKIGKRDIAKTIINGIYAVDRSINNIETSIRSNHDINIMKNDRLLLDNAFKAKTELARSVSLTKTRSNDRGMSL